MTAAARSDPFNIRLLLGMGAVVALIPVPWALRLYAQRGHEQGFLVVAGALVATAIALIVLRRSIDDLSSHSRVIRLTAIIWVSCVVMVLLEPWTSKISVLALLLPVVVATPLMVRTPFVVLAIGTVSAAMLVAWLGESPSTFDVYTGVNHDDRSLAVVVLTTLLTVLVLFQSGRNHEVLSEPVAALRRSRWRLSSSVERVRREFGNELEVRTVPAMTAVSDQLRAVSRDYGAKPGDAAPEILDDLQTVGRDLRELAHGVYPPELTQHGLAHALTSRAARSAADIDVSGDVQHLVPEAASVLYWCFNRVVTELEAEGGPAMSARLGSADRDDDDRADAGAQLVLAFHPAWSPSDNALEDVADRIGALTGDVWIEATTDRSEITIVLDGGDGPAQEPDVENTGRWGPRRSLALGLAFALVCVAASVTLRATVLPYDGMSTIVIRLVVLFLVPTAVACAVALRWATWAFAIYAVASWATVIAIVDTASLVLDFAPVALLLPPIMALPYVSRSNFVLLSFGTVIVSVVATAVGRYGESDDFTSASPDWLNDATVITFTVIAVALVAVQSARNRALLGARSAALRESRRLLVTQSDRERRDLERDIHDGVLQQLVAATVRLRAIELRSRTTGTDGRDQVRQIADDLDTAVSELRATSRGLYPLELDQLGLAECLRDLGRRTRAAVSVGADVDRFGVDVDAAVYFCCSEAVNNVLKHAGDNASAKVEVSAIGDELRFQVSDDGRGFGGRSNDGAGLRNIEARVQRFHGDFSVMGSPSRGTTVSGVLRPSASQSPGATGSARFGPPSPKTRAGTTEHVEARLDDGTHDSTSSSGSPR